MKEKLLNNLGLKILSLFLAFFVWLVVLNVSNPVVTGSKEVSLDIVNGKVLEAAGRTYEISGKSTATVYYDVHAKDEYRVRSTDFRAYVDLAELYDVTGSVQVKVEVLNNKELISNAEAKPGVVRVSTEELQEKPFGLALHTSGEAADGYYISDVSLEPSKLTVEGPVSKVGSISYAGVEINVDGLSANEEGEQVPIFYDANGNKLNISDRITVNPSAIRYQVTVSKVKNLPLDFRVTGTAAPGYRYTGVECEIENVPVIGTETSLASVNQLLISAPELNISGAVEDKTVAVDLRNYLPAGVTIASEERSMVQVLIKVEKLASRTLTLTEADIELKNRMQSYQYRLEPRRIEVTLQGLDADLEGLTPSLLGASVDLSGMQQGSNQGGLSIADSEVYNLISFTKFTVEVSELPAAPVIDGGSTTAYESSEEQTSMEEQTTAEETETEETKEPATHASSEAGR